MTIAIKHQFSWKIENKICFCELEEKSRKQIDFNFIYSPKKNLKSCNQKLKNTAIIKQLTEKSIFNDFIKPQIYNTRGKNIY